MIVTKEIMVEVYYCTY